MGVQEAVLSLVVEGPDYGYRIVRQLEEEHRWTSAAIYKALHRLRERGLIEPTEIAQGPTKHSRKWYRATTLGEGKHRAIFVESHIQILECLEGATPDQAGAMVDEFEGRLLKLLEELSPESSKQQSVTGSLMALERKLVCEARLQWISVVRGNLAKSPATFPGLRVGAA